MLPEQAIEISKVRFDHAKECLRDAKLLLAGESYRSAANRAYYAIFHAMRAVLALDGVDMKHHSGIISEFRKRYIKTGVFDASLSGLISELSDVREVKTPLQSELLGVGHSGVFLIFSVISMFSRLA